MLPTFFTMVTLFSFAPLAALYPLYPHSVQTLPPTILQRPLSFSTSSVGIGDCAESIDAGGLERILVDDVEEGVVEW